MLLHRIQLDAVHLDSFISFDDDFETFDVFESLKRITESRKRRDRAG